MTGGERGPQGDQTSIQIEEARLHQSNRAMLNLIDNVMVVNSRTYNDWQRFKEKFIVDSDGEEVFPGVKALWESIKSSPEAILCLSRLVGLARDGLSYYALSKELQSSDELRRLFPRD